MKTLLALFLASAALLHAADPVVSNLSASQRAGTELVDISYDVTADTATVTTSLRISSDSGATFDVPAVTLSGDIGADVTVGTGKTITWDAGTDWDEQFSETMRFELTADDGQTVVPEGMELIPAGSFQMGDSFSEGSSAELPVHSVYLSGFYMGRTEVTYSQWQEVYNWAVANNYSFDNAGAGKAANHPVHTVSWYDVVKWCNAASEREGLAPVYRTDDGSVYRTGQLAPVIEYGNSGYRLPTEAEWEKAARGGLSGKRFPWGNTITHSEANYYSSSSSYSYHPSFDEGGTPYTSPVGSFAPNDYGLYDMAGNVWEWCNDWYGSSYYGSSPGSDPTGPTSGTNRVVRGGSWNYDANYCRVAFRGWDYPDDRSFDFGFRLARSQ